MQKNPHIMNQAALTIAVSSSGTVGEQEREKEREKAERETDRQKAIR